MKKKILVTALIIFLISSIVIATTWFTKTYTCPVCETENKFKTIGSYGSYIYSWPSKYQYIYWPVTENSSVYSCNKCRYTAFMWDFKSLSGDTLEIIKNNIDNISISMQADSVYTDIPMSEKLETAESFYKLYQTDPDFWCRFSRIKGYHYDRENKPALALKSRQNAMKIADSLMQNPKNKFRKKELLFISASMKHFTGKDTLAVRQMEKAMETRYNNPKQDSSDNQGFNHYLHGIMSDFMHKIRYPEKDKNYPDLDKDLDKK